MYKKSQANITICRFLQSIRFLTQRKNVANLLTYGPPKNCYCYNDALQNMKAIVCSSDDDTNFFDISIGVMQGDTLAPYLFIIYLDYVLWTSIELMKENGLTLIKSRSRQYLTETITDADYTDDQVLLTNPFILGKSLLHSLE